MPKFYLCIFLTSHSQNLNHGSYGAVPHSVTSVRRCWSDRVEQVPDGWFRRDMYPTLDEVRAKLAKYINAASPDDVAFVGLVPLV